MGFLDRLPGIDEENTTRRNVLVGSGYTLVGLAAITVIGGDQSEDPDDEREGDSNGETAADDGNDEEDEDTTEEASADETDDEEHGDADSDTAGDENGDEELAIAFEDEWFGPVTEEPNPETFDPEDDWPTVETWMDDVVDHLEFVFLEMDVQSVDAWTEAADRASELEDQYFEEISPMFDRETDDGFVSDGIPAWDLELPSIIDGADESLVLALVNIQNGASDAEDDGEVAEFWIQDTGETIATVLVDLDAHDRYDYSAPAEA